MVPLGRLRGGVKRVLGEFLEWSPFGMSWTPFLLVISWLLTVAGVTLIIRAIFLL